MLDISQIPVGQLCDQQDTFPSDEEIFGNMVDLQGSLLAEESTLRLSNCDSDADEANGSTPEEPGAGTADSPGRMEVVAALAALNRGAQESMNPLLDANPKRRRARFSVARKLFYGDADLYLQLDPSMPQPSSTPPLVGQVVACPSKKNDNNYTIRWVRLHSGGEWPTHLISHLRTVFPKQSLQTLLPALIASCPLNHHNHSGVEPRQEQDAVTDDVEHKQLRRSSESYRLRTHCGISIRRRLPKYPCIQVVACRYNLYQTSLFVKVSSLSV
jgi:hypothetical protein